MSSSNDCILKTSEYGIHPTTKETIYEYHLSNNNGLECSILSLGCTFNSLKSKDKNGEMSNIILGYKSLQDWLNQRNFNSIVGRYANRIDKGEFTLNNQTYKLNCNNGPNHLHGGPNGFYSKNFKQINSSTNNDSVSLILQYISGDNEENYPGELTVNFTITINKLNELTMKFEATTNKTTIVNICNHNYYNLNGNYTENNTILNHKLQLNCSNFTGIDENMIPTGEIISVDHQSYKHMNFTKEKLIKQDIDVFENIEPPCKGGYDHNFVIDNNNSDNKSNDNNNLKFAARLTSPESGRIMEIYTSAPAIQLYTGNWLTGAFNGREGFPYVKHAALCLETQVFPNSPNQKGFPNCVLNPAETYSHIVKHVFKTQK